MVSYFTHKYSTNTKVRPAGEEGGYQQGGQIMGGLVNPDVTKLLKVLS